MFSDPKQMQETANETIRIYAGGTAIDQDIIYNKNGTQIFLPSGKAGVAGIIFKTIKSENQISLKQPEGVFVYNGAQYKIPIRYVYYNGQIADFKKGLEIVLDIIPKVDNSGQGIKLDNFGALAYLSPKVSKSLFAQLYLMDDPLKEYPTIKLAHSEDDLVVAMLKMQGLDTDFVYYQGFRGPIKIWDVSEIPENILVKEEFLRREGEWAEFDDLEFVK